MTCQEKKVKKLKAQKEKIIRVESEETQGYAREEHGSGTDLCTECDQCSAKADVSL